MHYVYAWKPDALPSLFSAHTSRSAAEYAADYAADLEYSQVPYTVETLDEQELWGEVEAGRVTPPWSNN